MKKEVACSFIIFLVTLIPFSFAKEINIPNVKEGETQQITTEETNYYALLGNEVVASVNNGEVEYLHKDRIGSNIVSSNGNIERSKTLPFGEKITNEGITYSFTGKELDSNNLYYFGARYYNPDSGRFLSIDPIMDNHPYVYTKNNPLMYTDPNGAEVKISISVPGKIVLAEGELVGNKFNIAGKTVESVQDIVNTLNKIAEIDPDLIKNSGGANIHIIDDYLSGEGKFTKTYSGTNFIRVGVRGGKEALAHELVHTLESYGNEAASEFQAFRRGGLINQKLGFKLLPIEEAAIKGDMQKFMAEYGRTYDKNALRAYYSNLLNAINEDEGTRSYKIRNTLRGLRSNLVTMVIAGALLSSTQEEAVDFFIGGPLMGTGKFGPEWVYHPNPETAINRVRENDYGKDFGTFNPAQPDVLGN